ncbi:MAG: Mrp/NBP35 family ATP-binding protein [Bacteroidetes bacterium]|nr:Mrp/NBP35 family ATP-binding protein [Rhodothermia bacterium]MCX7907847.1 Mrp/NBP35 family ATP-binding protein [Bacteroidota bacterium]MDW8138666.1 P-loop NTPase [Bacteroidota bacterium]MDW8284748.1 P-loop NTPase [Bacteroidota bacterium]
MAITQEAVLRALSQVIDPDLGRDLVSLGMIRDLRIEGRRIAFRVVLTTPACPLKSHIEQACRRAIALLVDPQAEVEIQMDARVTTARAAEEPLLPGVRNIVAVASGKGGVGKSTVAVNLAVALARSEAQVGLLDADIYGPSIPTMFGLQGVRPQLTEARKILPVTKFGVRLLSMGFLVDPDTPVVWRGPMVSSAVRQFLADADWGELDYLVLDLPPGTGDIQLTLVQTVPLTGAVIVSTPQDVALSDARKGVMMFRQVKVPVLGIVENMAYFSPPDLPDRRYYLFGQGGARRLAEELGVPFLGEIPLEQAVREGGDEGVPVVIRDPEGPSAQAFRELAQRVAQQVAIRNATVPPTEKVEIIFR